MNNLPKLYRPMTIRFSSLRNCLGSNMGVCFDCDEIVERKASRVLHKNGWFWKIINSRNLMEWDYCIETDQEILDEIGMDISLIRY